MWLWNLEKLLNFKHINFSPRYLHVYTVKHADIFSIFLDGVLMKHAKGKPTERHVFLFDGLIILCKPNIKRSSVTYPTGDFKLKEKFHIRKVEIKDKDDAEGTPYSLLTLCSSKSNALKQLLFATTLF